MRVRPSLASKSLAEWRQVARGRRGARWPGRLGLSRSDLAQVGDLLLEVLDTGERAIDAGEAQIRNLVEFPQRTEDRQTHLVSGHFGGATCANALLDTVSQVLQRVFGDRPTLAGPTHPADHLVTQERLGDSTALDDGQHGFLDRGEASATLRAGPPPAGGLTLIDIAGINDPRVRVVAERAPHRWTTSPIGPSSALGRTTTM